jgi:hypothetical protein
MQMWPALATWKHVHVHVQVVCSRCIMRYMRSASAIGILESLLQSLQSPSGPLAQAAL